MELQSVLEAATTCSRARTIRTLGAAKAEANARLRPSLNIAGTPLYWPLRRAMLPRCRQQNVLVSRSPSSLLEMTLKAQLLWDSRREYPNQWKLRVGAFCCASNHVPAVEVNLGLPTRESRTLSQLHFNSFQLFTHNTLATEQPRFRKLAVI